MKERKFIAIEGGDGSGKGTQAERLRLHINNILGQQAMKLSFPRYGESSAWYAGNYLDGAYGEADAVPADLAALAFAVDRFAARAEIEAHLESPNGFVIADRYMASNLAHQGTKISDVDERRAFYERTMDTEYNILGIPRPDLNIVLLLPTILAQANVDKKAARSYTTKTRDIHEANASHLDRAKANYEELCRLYPEEFTSIQCIDKNGVMRTIEEIENDIHLLLGMK